MLVKNYFVVGKEITISSAQKIKSGCPIIRRVRLCYYAVFLLLLRQRVQVGDRLELGLEAALTRTDAVGLLYAAVRLCS